MTKLKKALTECKLIAGHFRVKSAIEVNL